MQKHTAFSILLALAASLSLAVLQAQPPKSIWNTSAAYLGQKPPSDTPLVFAPAILHDKDTFPLDRVAFSQDGREFYFPSNTTWFDGKNAKIRYLTYDGHQWNGPFILGAHYYAPTFSMDDQTLYLLGGDRPDTLHSFVWQSKRTRQGWTKPTVYLQKEYGLYDFMPTSSGTAYVGSNALQGNRRDYSTYDFCELKMSKKDTSIRSLGPTLNTPGFDGDFFIARDESYIIISANETKDFECELYISFRKPDHGWTTPISLGPLINDGIAHRWGEYVSPDGKYLFYSKGHGPEDCNIYWVRFDSLLEKLRRSSL